MNPLLIRRRGMMMAAEVVESHLTFTALTDNSSVQLTAVGSAHALSLEYNIGGGWLPYTVGDTISLNAGDAMKMRGVNTTIGTSMTNYNKFVMAGRIEASGDITSLLNGVGGDATLSNYCFANTFNGCTSLVTAPNLPATMLTRYCYYSMFSGCTSLVTAPTLPATTLEINCYNSMFQGCTSLVAAPTLPATTLTSNCYRSMFQDCTSLVTAPNLPAITLAAGCYQAMFQSCTSLVTAPTLPATTLATDCYRSMFNVCTHITSHHVANLNNSVNVFQGNKACTSFIIDAVTPPTIGSSTITGLKSDCIIYVPAGSVAAYQAAQYWSARAAYIQATPNT